MCKKEMTLNALLKNYECVLKDILYFQNEGDNVSWCSVIATIASVILGIMGINVKILGVIFILLPVVQIFVMQRSLYAHKYVAMLRGYAAFLEEKINQVIKEDVFLYNSVLVNKYILTINVLDKDGWRISWIVTFVANGLLLLLCYLFALINPIFTGWGYYFFLSVLFIGYLYFVVALCVKFVKKEDAYIGARHPERIVRK